MMILGEEAEKRRRRDLPPATCQPMPAKGVQILPSAARLRLGPVGAPSCHCLSCLGTPESWPHTGRGRGRRARHAGHGPQINGGRWSSCGSSSPCTLWSSQSHLAGWQVGMRTNPVQFQFLFLTCNHVWSVWSGSYAVCTFVRCTITAGVARVVGEPLFFSGSHGNGN